LKGFDMAYSNTEKEKFVDLRAQGKSFAEIADILDVARSTLFNWQADLLNELREQRFVEYESLCRQNHLTRKELLERNIELLKRIDSEIDSSESAKANTKDLFKLRDSLLSKILKELNSSNIRIGEKTDLEKLIESEESVFISIE